MSSSLKSQTLEAFWSASPEAQTAILAQSQAYVTARVTILSALEQRVTQATALMLAAAAFSVGLAFNALKISPLAGLAGLAAMAFAIGGVICFLGVRPGNQLMPGIEPAHWLGAHGLTTMKQVDVDYFILAQTHDTIESLKAQGARRAAALQLGLQFGIAGAALLSLAGALVLFASA